MTEKLYLITEAQIDAFVSAVGDKLGRGIAHKWKSDLLQALALLQGKPAAYRLPDPDAPKKYHYFDLYEVEPVKHALEALYTSPQAITPITAADITPTMYQEWSKIFRADDMSIACPKDGEIIAAAYNAVIKPRS